MPNLWDFIHRSAPIDATQNAPPQHNLQEGLFQIATHTCSLLVQVNNTSNITTFSGAGVPANSTPTNIKCIQTTTTTSRQISSATATTTAGDNQEQLVVLLPPTTTTSTVGTLKSFHNGFNKYRRRLSTVLEGSGTAGVETDTDLDLWNQGYMLRDFDDDDRVTRWKNQTWCKPSYIPITFIVILIFLVVLLPLLDHAMIEDNKFLNEQLRKLYANCPQSCEMTLVETIPDNLTYPNGSVHFPPTHEIWDHLMTLAEEKIEIGSYYWSLKSNEVWPDPSSQRGQAIFDRLLNIGTSTNIQIKIAQNLPSHENPNIDTEYLMRRKAADVRSLNFAKIIGAGILHTKVWIVDRKHVYVGSANMDWRSLSQVKELGIVFKNCSCLAEDFGKIFDVYWMLGETQTLPNEWPQSLATIYNADNPMNLSINNHNGLQTYISSSPPQFSPPGRTQDVDAIVNIIRNAEKFIYISVMDYFPLTIYTPRPHYWPIIDDALRTAAVDNNVQVKLLISQWNHSRSSEDYFLKSLTDISNSFRGVNIEVKRFRVPGTPDQNKIPFARVNHNKYMVTDNTAYIGTSNWSGDYFINTAGIGMIIHDPMLKRNGSEQTIPRQLRAIFERDWNSSYATYPPQVSS